MLDFLASIADSIVLLFEFMTAFFTNVIEVVKLIGKGAVFAFQAMAFFPPQYQVVLIAIVAYCIIVTILHFGG